MNFRFLRDLQSQPDDSIFSNFGNEIYASFIPSAASQGGDSLVSTVLGLSPIPSFWNQGTSSTVTLLIDYSGTGGGAAAGPDHGLYESYSSIRSYLINNATPGDATFNALPTGSSIQGQSNVAVWNAQLKL